MPLDAFSPPPSLASTQAPDTLATAIAPGRKDLAVPRLTYTPAPSVSPSAHTHLFVLISLWLLLYVTAAFTPPLLDDADATHAQAAQSMLSTGDWVTLHVDGIRYLEKPPLPYWITAVSLKLFAPAQPPYGRAAAFAVHFPLALTILCLALLGYTWARRAFNQTAALYTGLFLLTSAGVFLFTRVFIPDALLSLLLAFTLYAFLRTLNPRLAPTHSLIPSEPHSAQPKDPDPLQHAITSGPFPPKKLSPSAHKLWPYLMWTALALAVLTKGLVAIVFILATTFLFLVWTRQLNAWRQLRPFTGLLLFLAIAAPWHILAGLRNTGGANGHGFFWFYFINEHVLRFLGRRIPRDYNKLPTSLYWTLHLVWLFPWSLFLPTALLAAYRNRRTLLARPHRNQPSAISGTADNAISGTPNNAISRTPNNAISATANNGISGTANNQVPQGFSLGSHSPSMQRGFSPDGVPSSNPGDTAFGHQTTVLLLIFSALVLAFFSLSTNQEYYTFPVYLPLLMLLAASLTSSQRNPLDPTLRRAFSFTFATYTVLGVAISVALAYGLWSSRHLPFVPDIGALLAHRNVGDYTLSMSHFFDLTGPSFAALRLPAALALIAFLTGPAIAWLFYIRGHFLPAVLSIAATSSIFLLAAHIAFVRFSPMLSSFNFAETIQTLEHTHQVSPNTAVLLFGDQAFGSSIPFYLNRQVYLVDGRTTSMLFGSTFPDAPHLFLTPADLLAQWGHGPRKLLFVPLDQRDAVDHLLGSHQIILQQTSGKALISDRPLPPGS